MFIIVVALALMGSLLVGVLIQPTTDKHHVRSVTSCALNMGFWNMIESDSSQCILGVAPEHRR